jgi:hypothetical protein
VNSIRVNILWYPSLPQRPTVRSGHYTCQENFSAQSCHRYRPVPKAYDGSNDAKQDANENGRTRNVSYPIDVLFLLKGVLTALRFRKFENDRKIFELSVLVADSTSTQHRNIWATIVPNFVPDNVFHA